ncbi:MAG: glycosyltransferase family 2 protein [Candidatus Thiodiazotropha sp.]
MKTAVVIPVYNEAATIRKVVTETLRQVDCVIVVDDGSTDHSLQQIDGLDVHCLKNPHNMGKAESLRNGFAHALTLNVDAVITLDGDGQHDPEEIPKLLAAANEQPDTIILAARLKQRQHAPRLRRFANRFADFWVSWAAGYPVVDSQSGFRLYPAAVLRTIRLETPREKGFVFESEILIEAANKYFYSTSISVVSIYRKEARDSHYRPWTDTWRIVRMIAGRLLRRGFYPSGLFRSLRLLPDPRNHTLGKM